MKRILHYPKLLSLTILVGLVSLLLTSARTEETTSKFHTAEELEMYQRQGMGGDSDIELPVKNNELFASSGRCTGCHGFDPEGVASTTGEGEDVNITDDWRASMMANSAKDPFWRAKVSHEVTVNPGHQTELEDKCTTCHAPAGNFNAHFIDEPHYSMAMLTAPDTLGIDGVNCVACHQQSPDGIGSRFSGELTFDQAVAYGPYSENIFGAPMISFVGYEPLYDEYITKSEACAGCHSLLTGTVDLEGESTGDMFVEQATYHEWLNSVYAVEGSSTECQDCHMPAVNEPIVLSSGYAFLPGREPFSKHHLVGGNTFMLELMKNRREELGIWANDEHYDRTIQRTLDMLQNQSVIMEVSDAELVDDSLLVEVDITNLTGHKFPSGYPSRRAYLEFVVTDMFEDTLFASGVLQPDYEVFGQDPFFEPHYEQITEEDQVQIYEMVFGDVNGDVSTVLERAASKLKDNRLVPIGFTTEHEVYDTTTVSGLALSDPNFNKDEIGVEGTGADKVIYKLGFPEFEGELNVSVKLFYQSLPPKWMEEMFSVSTPEIDSFKQMYEEEGPDPVLIDEGQTGLFYVGVDDPDWRAESSVFPNPSVDGFTWLNVPSSVEMREVNLYSISGQLIKTISGGLNSRIRIDLPDGNGVFIIEAVGNDGKRMIERIVK